MSCTRRGFAHLLLLLPLALGPLVACGEPTAVLSARDLLAREADPASVAVHPGETVAYRLESPRVARVELSARSDSEGRLEVAFSAIGSLRGGRRALEQPRRVAADRFELALAVPALDAGELLEIRVSWQTEGASPLALERLLAFEERATALPPVLFISADTFSAYHTSLHGYERRTTPVLEELAREAVTFERCIANAPWTEPSYVSQFSGLYPGAALPLGEPESDGGQIVTVPLAPERWTLAEAMRAAGYRTAAFAGNPFFRQDLGFEQGFDRYAPAPLGDDGLLRDMLASIRSWLAELAPSDVPFLFLNAMDTHAPYTPPAPYRGKFADDGLFATERAAPVVSDFPHVLGGMHYFGQIPRYVAEGAFPPGAEIPEVMAVDELVAAYDEEVLSLDATIGDLLSAWRAAGLWEESVVIVSADHGESLGEHDWLFAHGVPWGEVTRVPLIVKLPGGGSAGSRVTQPVQLVDLYPTLLELAGLDTDGRGLHGRSLVPALFGRELPDRPILSQGGALGGGLVEHDGWRLIEIRPEHARTAAVVTHPLARSWIAEHRPELEAVAFGQIDVEPLLGAGLTKELYQLVFALSGPHYELYDLANDPRELIDLADSRQDRLDALRALLDGERARAAEARIDSIDVRIPGPRDEAERAELERLGYLGDD